MKSQYKLYIKSCNYTHSDLIEPSPAMGDTHSPPPPSLLLRLQEVWFPYRYKTVTDARFSVLSQI